MQVQLEVFNFDDHWQQVLVSMLSTKHKLDEASDESSRDCDELKKDHKEALQRYNAFLLRGTDRKKQAERLARRLEKKFPSLEFSAHSNVLGDGWRVLVRIREGKGALPGHERSKLSIVAAGIMNDLR